MKEGWKMVKLGEVCEIKGGKRVPKGYKLKNEKTNYPYIRVTDFNDNGTVSLDDIHYIDEEVFKQIKRYIITTDDVYVSIAGTIGKCGIIPEELNGANLTENACRLVLNRSVYNRYLLSFFQTEEFKKESLKAARTTSQPKLSLNRLSEIQFPLPPLSEQTRIVSLLDDAFGKLERSREKALKLLDDAKEIFQAQLKKEMTPKEGWEVKKIGDVGKVTTGQTPSTSHKDYFGGNIPFIKPADINIDGCGNINLQNEGLTEEGCSNSRSIEGDSVLMVCIGATIGKTGYVQNSKIAFNQQINAISEIKDCDIKFIYYALIGNDFQEQVMNEGKSAQATLPIINKKKWANLEIPLPPLSEQSSIVSRLDVLSSQLKQIEETTNKYLADLDELKQSLLKKAFEGKL